MSAESPLQSIEIISAGKTVWSGMSVAWDVNLDIPLGQVEDSTYFYLRAIERQGGLIYASPVFVTVKEAPNE